MRIRFVLVAFVFGFTGCSYFAQSVAREMTKTTPADHELTVVIARSAEFGQCLRTPGGRCNATKAAEPEMFAPQAELRPVDLVVDAKDDPDRDAVEAANKVFADPAGKKIAQLYNELRGSGTAARKSEIDIGVSDVAVLQEEVADAVRLHGFDAAAARHQARLTAALQSRDGHAIASALENARQSFYVKEYVNAYFRNGKFVQLTIDATALEAKFKKELEAQVPGADASDLANQLAKEFKAKYGQKVFGAISAEAFVTRDGASYQFPAVNAELVLGPHLEPTITKIDASAVGSDLVRVFLEALFDASNGLPAVANATGVTMGGEYALPKHPDPLTKVTDEEFAKVQQYANGAEAAASAIFGRIIRGASWVSLNNESLAKLLETIVGVTVRKATEKAAWCWFSCSHEPAFTRPSAGATLWDVQRANGDVKDANVVVLRVHG